MGGNKNVISKDTYIDEASNSIFQMNADPQVLKRCLDREEYYLDLKTDKRIIAESKAVIKAQKKKLKAKDNEIRKLRSLIKRYGIDTSDRLSYDDN